MPSAIATSVAILCTVIAVAVGTAGAAIPPTLTPPIGLPFAGRAVLAAGPHENTIHECLPATHPKAPKIPKPAICNSLDLRPLSGNVLAAAAGRVIAVPRACDPVSPYGSGRVGLVVIDHGNGWYTGYYHLKEIAVHAGENVAQGALLGHPATNDRAWPRRFQIYGFIRSDVIPCGGSWYAPHVHFFVKYTTSRSGIGDPFQNSAPDVDLQNVVIGGWRITKTAPTQGCMTYLATGVKRCSPSGIVTNGECDVSLLGSSRTRMALSSQQLSSVLHGSAVTLTRAEVNTVPVSAPNPKGDTPGSAASCTWQGPPVVPTAPYFFKNSILVSLSVVPYPTPSLARLAFAIQKRANDAVWGTGPVTKIARIGDDSFAVAPGPQDGNAAVEVVADNYVFTVATTVVPTLASSAPWLAIARTVAANL